MIEIPHPVVARAPVPAADQILDVPTDLRDNLEIRWRQPVAMASETPDA